MPARTTGSRLNLKEPLASDLLDFCAANYRASEIEVIREAVREHIDRRLQEPEMRKRFDEVRQRRLSGMPKEPLRLIKSETRC